MPKIVDVYLLYTNPKILHPNESLVAVATTNNKLVAVALAFTDFQLSTYKVSMCDAHALIYVR